MEVRAVRREQVMRNCACGVVWVFTVRGAKREQEGVEPVGSCVTALRHATALRWKSGKKKKSDF